MAGIAVPIARAQVRILLRVQYSDVVLTSSKVCASGVQHRRRATGLRSYGLLLVRPDSGFIKRPKQVALATLQRAEQAVCFLHPYARVAASSFPILSDDQSAERESHGAYRR